MHKYKIVIGIGAGAGAGAGAFASMRIIFFDFFNGAITGVVSVPPFVINYHHFGHGTCHPRKQRVQCTKYESACV